MKWCIMSYFWHGSFLNQSYMNLAMGSIDVPIIIYIIIHSNRQYSLVYPNMNLHWRRKMV